MNASTLAGRLVEYVVGGAVAFSGPCLYVRDGWAGIQSGSAVDECRADLCRVVDPVERTERAVKALGWAAR